MNTAPAISARNESSCILEAIAIMRRCGVTDVESEVLQQLARDAKMASTPYHLSFLSMAQSIEKHGSEQKTKLLEIAINRSGETDAALQIFAFCRETIPRLIAEVTRGREEGDAKREFRERIAVLLKQMYPDATPAAIALTVGQSFEDTPGVWTFRTERVVLALRNPKRL